MKNAVASACVFLLARTALWGQVPGPAVRFEVASVKAVRNWPPTGGGTGVRGEPGKGGGCPTSMRVDPTRVEFRCATLAMLIGYAFRFSPDRIQGPEWMSAASSPRFDIAANLPQGASKEQVPQMMQALLAERFALEVHHGTSILPVYALVVARGGLKLQAAVEASGSEETGDAGSAGAFYGSIENRTVSDGDGRPAATMIRNPRMGTVKQTGDPFQMLRWEAASITMTGLAELMDQAAPLSSPIVDMTGITGRYRLVLEVSLKNVDPRHGGGDPEEFEERVLRGINEGLMKRGLRLERRRGRVETIVVDGVEKAPKEN